MPIIPALRRLNQETHEFKATLGYIVRLLSNTHTHTQTHTYFGKKEPMSLVKVGKCHNGNYNYFPL
jgi:hypothetical protein